MKEEKYVNIRTKKEGRKFFVKLRAIIREEAGEKLENHEIIKKAYQKIKEGE